MEEVLDWMPTWNWSQFIPDALVAIITGLVVAIALRWSDRRAEIRRVRGVAEAELSPLAGTLEMALAGGVVFETVGNSGSASLIPSQELRERVERARQLEGDLGAKCAEEFKQTSFLGHVATHLDTMQRDAELVEQQLASALRQLPELSVEAVDEQRARLRDAILEPHSGLVRISKAHPGILGDEEGFQSLRWRLESYLTSRRLADMASRAYSDYCMASRSIAHSQGLEIISSREQRKEMRKCQEIERALRDKKFENKIMELQRYMPGC